MKRIAVCLFLFFFLFLSLFNGGLVQGQNVEDPDERGRPRDPMDKANLPNKVDSTVPVVEGPKTVKKEEGDVEKLKKSIKNNTLMSRFLMVSNLILSVVGIFMMSKMARASGKPREEGAADAPEDPMTLPGGFLENDDFERCDES